MLTYARHAVRNGDGRQISAIHEGTPAYARCAVGDDNRCKHRTAIKCAIKNITTRYCYTSQRRRDIICGKFIICTVGLIDKCILRYGLSSRVCRVAEYITEKTFSTVLRKFPSPDKRDRYAHKLTATRKGTGAYTCHAIRDSNNCKATTILKSIIPYALYAVRNCDGCQPAAILEGLHSYARHAVADGDGGQAAATIEGITPYASHIIGDGDVRHRLVFYACDGARIKC